MAFLEQMGVSLTAPVVSLVRGVINSLPGIIGAILVLIVGYIVALIVHWLVSKGLGKVKFDKWLSKNTKISKYFGAMSTTELLAVISKWYTFILFLPAAAGILSIKLRAFADFLVYIAAWIPHLIAAIVIALLGVVAAEYVAHQIEKSKAKGAGLVAGTTKIVILIFVAIVALKQAGIQVAVAEYSFLIVLGGIMLGIAIAVGIGFGNALKDDAKKVLKQIKGK